MSLKLSDKQLLRALSEDKEFAIDQLFRQYYSMICIAVYRIYPDQSYAEDIAQEVFLEIWRRRKRLKINTSLGAYLRRVAINKTLNFIRDQKFNFETDKEPIFEEVSPQNVTEKLEVEELKLIIDKTIDKLPEKCRIVFILNRFEEMSYREISEELGISVKTVEHQISKALKFLRQKLGPYIGILTVFAGFL